MDIYPEEDHLGWKYVIIELTESEAESILFNDAELYKLRPLIREALKG